MSRIIFTETGFAQYVYETNRLVYEVAEDRITVKSCCGHYEE